MDADPAPTGGRIIARGSRTVYRNAWMTVREDDVEFPDGQRGIFGVIDKPDFAIVLPHEDDGFWLVEQYRYPVGARTWEFPLGAWPDGVTGSVRELAEAELREETGKTAQTLTCLGQLHTAPGVVSNAFTVFLAEGLADGPTARETTESDMVCEWRSRADLRAMLRSGTFLDSQSVAAYALFCVLRPD